jgi:hypothetical protein
MKSIQNPGLRSTAEYGRRFEQRRCKSDARSFVRRDQTRYPATHHRNLH